MSSLHMRKRAVRFPPIPCETREVASLFRFSSRGFDTEDGKVRVTLPRVEFLHAPEGAGRAARIAKKRAKKHG